MNPVGQILIAVLQIFFLLLIVRLVMEYVLMFARSWQPHGVALVVLEAVYTVTDPPLKALRRVIPPLRLGGVAIDLSFLVLIILVQVLIYIVRIALL